jgi:GntR family transcriptional regulator
MLEESETLRIAPGAPIFDIERLRMLDGIPILVDGSRIPVSRAPWLADVDLGTASLYASLEERGLIPTSADYTIGVLDADERLAALLDVPVGTGLLLATGVTRDQLGKPFELARAAYRADRYRIEVTLARGPSGPASTR